jgi:hypothetical protein
MRWQDQKVQTYNGAISMGKTFAVIHFIFVTLIAFIFLYYAFKWILNPYREKTYGKVKEVNCQKHSSYKYNCNMKIQYKVDFQIYDLEISNIMTESPIKKDEWIDVYYQKKEPVKATLKKPNVFLGSILFVMAFIIEIIGLIYIIYIFKYKGLAAVSGVSKVFFH